MQALSHVRWTGTLSWLESKWLPVFLLALFLSLNALNGDVCVFEPDDVYEFPLEMRINVVWVGVAGVGMAVQN